MANPAGRGSRGMSPAPRANAASTSGQPRLYPAHHSASACDVLRDLLKLGHTNVMLLHRGQLEGSSDFIVPQFRSLFPAHGPDRSTYQYRCF